MLCVNCALKLGTWTRTKNKGFEPDYFEPDYWDALLGVREGIVWRPKMTGAADEQLEQQCIGANSVDRIVDGRSAGPSNY